MAPGIQSGGYSQFCPWYFIHPIICRALFIKVYEPSIGSMSPSVVYDATTGKKGLLVAPLQEALMG